MELMPVLDTKDAWETVHRIVFPTRDADLTLPLYATPWTPSYLRESVLDARTDMQTINWGTLNHSKFDRIVEDASKRSNANGTDHISTGDIISRRGIRIAPRSRTSFCTFFNAFPAAYWQRWTKVRRVRLVAEVAGTGKLTVFRSTGRGLFNPVARLSVNAPDPARPQHVEAIMPLTNLMDGGYIWFDAANDSDDAPLQVLSAEWQVPVSARTAQSTPAKPHSTLSIAITTFNRPSYCLDLLKDIAQADELRKRLDTIYCVDQGTDHVSDQPDFNDTARRLGSQLTYLRQPNLGGSGGYSRGMFETAEAGNSDYVLLHDDDAITEPEAILRAVQFADYTVRPTLVGGGMFHLDNRTVLYTQGERLDPRTIWMKSSLELPYNHDFAMHPLRDSPERHQRIDADFNGWWMCLIPVRVIKEIGLSLPVFIKFDDTEYCIRAREHGYPTVCLPGVAVWHQAWHDKDPARTWEEYFFQRNRWIFALLHCRKPTLRMMFEMMYGDLNVGLRFLYSALYLRHKGLKDIMRGPEYIVSSMPGKLAEVRKERAAFEDTHASGDREDFPEPAREFISHTVRPRSRSKNTRSGVYNIVRGLLGMTDASNAKVPDVAIPAKDAFWSSFANVNSAIVTTSDGNSVSWLKRNDRLFRKDMIQGLRLAWRYTRRFERLSKEYRDYDIAGFDVWRKIFSNPND
ncbi:glycosyltransferase [Bifidobacterium sp. SO1]|nr:glycosyltransferase [Bifidobacterium sp. SO1]